MVMVMVLMSVVLASLVVAANPSSSFQSSSPGGYIIQSELVNTVGYVTRVLLDGQAYRKDIFLDRSFTRACK
jgi:hypothetical protein